MVFLMTNEKLWSAGALACERSNCGLNSSLERMNAAKYKAKGQWLRAAFSRHSSAPQSGGKFTSSKAQFFPELKSTRGRGNWGPNGRSQSTGLQAVLGFPGQPAFIAGRSSADAAPDRIRPYYSAQARRCQ